MKKIILLLLLLVVSFICHDSDARYKSYGYHSYAPKYKSYSTPRYKSYSYRSCATKYKTYSYKQFNKGPKLRLCRNGNISLSGRSGACSNNGGILN